MNDRNTGTAPVMGAVSIPSKREANDRIRRIIERSRVRYATVDFIHDREPPKEWVDRLAEYSPPTDAHSFLSIVWEPGDPWIPVQRWTLQQMVHPSVISRGILQELRRPNPRVAGHMCTSVPTHAWAVRPSRKYQPCVCRRKTEAWRDGHCSEITLLQWKVFQRTGYLARPFWTIQGGNGGHRDSFTPQEQLMLEHVGYPTSTPARGSLPYAPFDERVMQQLPRFNRLWKLGVTLERFQRMMSPDGYAQFRKGEEKEMRQQMIHEVEDDMREVADLFIVAARKGEMDDQPRTEIDYDRLGQLNDQHFVETGQILSHTKA